MQQRMVADFYDFAKVMMEKLEKNSHKRTVEESDVPAMLSLLMIEVGEFIRQYMEDKEDPNAERELADIANFAFLIYQAIRRKDV